MADHVIIAGARRGGEELSDFELAQMMGRAGRKHGAESRVSVLIEDEEDEDWVTDILKGGGSFKVSSCLAMSDALSFHCLAEIDRLSPTTIDDLGKVFSRSLAMMQEGSLSLLPAVQSLIDAGMVMVASKKIMVTDFGKVTSKFYYHPRDVIAWKNNFEDLFQMARQDQDEFVACALSMVPSDTYRADLSKSWPVIRCFQDCVGGNGLELEGHVATCLSWWGLLGGPKPSSTTQIRRMLKSDAGRLMHLLLGLNDVFGWQEKEFLEDLAVRIVFDVPKELANLCKTEFIEKSHASELYNLGVGSLGDLIEKFDEVWESASLSLRRVLSKVVEDEDFQHITKGDQSLLESCEKGSSISTEC